MLDLAIGTEAKNYGLKRGPNPQMVWECIKILLPLGAITCAFSFHLWVHAQSIQIGYQRYRLSEQNEELLNEQRQLVVQEQTLKDQRLLDSIAANDFGLIILRANPPIPARLEHSNADSQGNPQVGSLFRNSGSQKPTLLN